MHTVIVIVINAMYSTVYNWGDQNTRTSRWILYAHLFLFPVKLVLKPSCNRPNTIRMQTH